MKTYVHILTLWRYMKWSPSCSGCFTAGGNLSRTCGIGSWLDPKPGLDQVAKVEGPASAWNGTFVVQPTTDQ